MLARLTRILLALVTAFVFTGQMEAAAQHCAKLIAATLRPGRLSRLPQRQANALPATACDDAPHRQDRIIPRRSKPPPTCECIAALTACCRRRAHGGDRAIEPYAWLRRRNGHASPPPNRAGPAPTTRLT